MPFVLERQRMLGWPKLKAHLAPLRHSWRTKK